MERIDALKQLAAKVEAGELEEGFCLRQHASGIGMNATMWNAYNGSRDASKGLRDATLPGWHIILWGHKEFCATVQNPTERHIKGTAKGACEARTEFLATIRAMIAMEEAK